MNFLNPLVLTALAAALLPIIIHFMSKKKPKNIPFPSVIFLKTMQSDRLNLLRFKQLLMLLLRTLIILFLVLAFARPALRSFFNKDSAISAVTIIDNSASMMYVENGELLFDKALRKASEITSSLRDMDMGGIIVGVNEPYFMGQGITADKNYLIRQLKNIHKNYGENNPSAAIRTAVEILKASGTPNKEIYYITDAASNSIPDSLISLGENTRLYIITLGPEERDDSIIEDISLGNKILTPGREAIFKVKGILGASENETSIEFFVNGERKGLKKVNGKPSETVEADFAYVPEDYGWMSVYAKTGEGYFEPGEIRRMSLRIPGLIRVLIIGGEEDDNYYIEKALDFARSDSLLTMTTVTEKTVSRENLSETDIIILSGVKDLTEPIYRCLVSEVIEKGKGVMIFPDSDFKTQFYAGKIYRDIFPLSAANIVNTPEGVSIKSFDFTHNALKGISDTGNFSKPVAKSYIRMNPVENPRSLAVFNDGSTALWEAECGRGKVAVFAFDASTDMSDFPLTGVFMPVVMQLVRFLSGSDFSGGAYLTGDTISETVTIGEKSKVAIKPEDGPAYFVNPFFLGNKVIVSGIRAGKPGFFSIVADGKELSRYSVNSPLSEAIYVRVEGEKLKKAFSNQHWKILEGSSDILDAVNKDRFGSELSGLFLMIALGLMFVEMALSKRV
jgi:hypothetical protein